MKERSGRKIREVVPTVDHKRWVRHEMNQGRIITRL